MDCTLCVWRVALPAGSGRLIEIPHCSSWCLFIAIDSLIEQMSQGKSSSCRADSTQIQFKSYILFYFENWKKTWCRRFSFVGF